MIGERVMNVSIIREPDEPGFDWDKFSRFVFDSYGSHEYPDYLFSHRWFAEKKYPEIINFIKDNYQFSEDTDSNTDVSYGFVLKETTLLRVSFVGPYFYMSSVLDDGSQSEPVCDMTASEVDLSLRNYLYKKGFICTPSSVLCQKVQFGNGFLSVYAILYSYEDEPPWVGAKT